MNVAIVLGNWLNDDGSISLTLEKRLELVLELINESRVQKVVVSGGLANVRAGITEAEAMNKYLLSRNVNENMIIIENQSTTTRENALFSIPKAMVYNPKEIIVVSTYEHFTIYSYNVIRMFEKVLGKYNENSNTRLVIYTNTLTKSKKVTKKKVEKDGDNSNGK